MRDVCYPLPCPILTNPIIYIDGPYVPAVSLEVGKLHVQAPVHDLRARWGSSLCRRHRGEHKVIYLHRDRCTRRAAICGRIRCMGSVSLVEFSLVECKTHHCIMTSPKSSVIWQTQRVLSPLALLSRPVVGVDKSGSVIVVGEMLLYGSWYP